MTRHELVTLADSLEPRNYEDGEILFNQGDIGDVCYILMEGSVALTQTSELPVAEVNGGNMPHASVIIEGDDDDDIDVNRIPENTNEFVRDMKSASRRQSNVGRPDQARERIISESSRRVKKAGFLFLSLSVCYTLLCTFSCYTLLCTFS